MGRASLKGSGRYFVWHVPGSGSAKQGKEAVDELVRSLLAGTERTTPSDRRPTAAIFPEYVI